MMPPPPKKRKRGLVIGIIAGVVALALIAGGLTYAFAGRKGASSPQGAVEGMMTSLAGGKVSTISMFQALATYLPPSELALIDTGSLIDALRDPNSIQRVLMDDIDAIASNFTVQVSNLKTSTEMIDTGLARVSILDFTMNVRWDIQGIKTGWHQLLTDIIDIGAQLSKSATSAADDLTGNWIGAGFVQLFSRWLVEQFNDGNCQAPPDWSDGNYSMTTDQALSSQAINCLSDQGATALNQTVLDSMSRSGFSFPFTLSSLIRDGFAPQDLMSRYSPAAGPFIMAVQEGGRWYVSPFMTQAEYSACTTVRAYSGSNQCAPATAGLAAWAPTVANDLDSSGILSNLRHSAPTTATTSPTPGASVQTTLDALAALPSVSSLSMSPQWYQAISALASTLPTAERRLYGTYPGLLSGALSGSSINRLNGQFSVASQSKGRAIVRIDSLSAPGDPTFRIHDGTCLSMSSFDGCLSQVFDANTYAGSGLSIDPALFAKAVLAFQQKAPLDQVGLVALQEKGGWQFSPTGTSWYLATWLWKGTFAALNALVAG